MMRLFDLWNDHRKANTFLKWSRFLIVLLWITVASILFLFNGLARGAREFSGDTQVFINEPPVFTERTGQWEPPESEVVSFTRDSPLATLLDKYFFLPVVNNASGALYVRPANRQESLEFYQRFYLVKGVDIGWTGSVASCTPGFTAQAFRDAVALRINYFRAMAGVPAKVTLLDVYNQKAQKSALMMSANNALSHNPPTSWKCYTDEGHEAAGSSNLALGGYGLDALRMYMQDFGSGNTAVGHRRWILYPQTQNMGSGDIPGGGGYATANDLWVFDSHLWDPRPATREAFVAWPPPGYVPYPVVYARWSFSYAGADFDSATVSMTENGANIALTRYAPAYGYGENTLVWIRTGMNDRSIWPRPLADTTYVVTVNNVKIGGVPRSFQYTVIVFDPG